MYCTCSSWRAGNIGERKEGQSGAKRRAGTSFQYLSDSARLTFAQRADNRKKQKRVSRKSLKCTRDDLQDANFIAKETRIEVSPVPGWTKTQRKVDTNGESQNNMTPSINSIFTIISQRQVLGTAKDLQTSLEGNADQAKVLVDAACFEEHKILKMMW